MAEIDQLERGHRALHRLQRARRRDAGAGEVVLHHERDLRLDAGLHEARGRDFGAARQHAARQQEGAHRLRHLPRLLSGLAGEAGLPAGHALAAAKQRVAQAVLGRVRLREAQTLRLARRPVRSRLIARGEAFLDEIVAHESLACGR